MQRNEIEELYPVGLAAEISDTAKSLDRELKRIVSEHSEILGIPPANPMRGLVNILAAYREVFSQHQNLKRRLDAALILLAVSRIDGWSGEQKNTLINASSEILSETFPVDCL